MTRLRNRMRKAELLHRWRALRWHRDKRTTYDGIWAMAEDSGCLEDDPFEWKMTSGRVPGRRHHVEVLEEWRDELIEAGKLVPYEADGKRYLFFGRSTEHEKPPVLSALICRCRHGSPDESRRA